MNTEPHFDPLDANMDGYVSFSEFWDNPAGKALASLLLFAIIASIFAGWLMHKGSKKCIPEV